jgi:two-component system sensor histidine kinase YesM
MLRMKHLKSEMTLSFIIVAIVIITSVELISFWWIKDMIETKVSETTVETLKQIDKNMNSIYGNSEDISKYTIANREVRKFLKLKESEFDQSTELLIRINEEYANLTNSKSFIAAINFFGKNNLKFESAGSSFVMDVDQAPVIEVPEDGTYILTPTYKRYYYTLGEQYIMSFYRQIKDINDFQNQLGTLRIDISENVVNSIYKDIVLGQTGYFFITDKKGFVISHSDKKLLGSDLHSKSYYSTVFDTKEGYYKERIDGRDVLITFFQSDQHNMIYLGQVPYKELMYKVDSARNLTLFLTLIAILISLLFFHILSTRISNPIRTLTGFMKQVEKGDFNVTVDSEREDEIGQLSRSFNQMVNRIKELIEEVYLTKIKKKEAELDALQSQINPHFLYNTLDIAYWSSRMEDAPITEEIISNLSNFFKLGLNKGKEITTIGKEVEHLNSYLYIQLLRYDEKPEIIVKVDEKLYNYKLIKLILQPLVENALLHGISDMDAGGRIEVLGTDEGDDIIFEVRDNGKGIESSRLATIFDEDSKHEGYGVKNVQDRIKIYYGESYGLTIQSEIQLGTTVKIRIPKLQNGVNKND